VITRTDKYVVRASRDDVKSQMGKYSILANAIKQAADFGLNVYDLETGNLVFEHAATKKEQFMANLRYMNKIMKQDIKAGHKWTYSNVSGKKGKNFEDTRKQGKYHINCVDGPHWAMKMMGLMCCSWFGAKGGGISWCAKNAEKETRKHFDIIQTDKKKTVKQLIANGTIQPGDILTYVAMNHTNVYLGNNQSWDSGSGSYTTGHTGEGAVFKKWIGSLACGGYKVGCILRLKEKTKGYRVQVGAFSTPEKIAEAKKLCKEAGFDTFEEPIDGMTRVYCGSFSVIANAVERWELVKKMFTKAYIRGI
jgi:hypothetical protein